MCLTNRSSWIMENESRYSTPNMGEPNRERISEGMTKLTVPSYVCSIMFQPSVAPMGRSNLSLSNVMTINSSKHTNQDVSNNQPREPVSISRKVGRSIAEAKAKLLNRVAGGDTINFIQPPKSKGSAYFARRSVCVGPAFRVGWDDQTSPDPVND